MPSCYTKKPKSRFKVGDWVVSGGIPIYQHLLRFNPDYRTPTGIPEPFYNTEDECGRPANIYVRDENIWHPWNVKKDAQKFDVLQFSESHYILVKQIADNKLISYADLVGDELRVCTLSFDLDFYPLNPWYPAPSAQRIKLLSELRKAGYKIDYKKDDLIKLDKPIIETQGKISASKYPDGSIQISGLSEGQYRIIMSLIESWS